jgi:hypothetical protein
LACAFSFFMSCRHANDIRAETARDWAYQKHALPLLAVLTVNGLDDVGKVLFDRFGVALHVIFANSGATSNYHRQIEQMEAGNSLALICMIDSSKSAIWF